MNDVLAQENILRNTKPETAEELWHYVNYFFGIKLIREKTCPEHDAELDYISYAFFEEKDSVLHSNRGGGKTSDGAILTVLEAIHKPGWQGRLLGGSSAQSEKMYDYTSEKWDRPGFRQFLLYPPFKYKTMLKNGSLFKILTQSTKSVRGDRVHRLRCDEIDEFHPKVWKSAMFVTKSSAGIKGSLEILSTMHKVGGIMSEVLKRAQESGTRIFKWCLLDVLEKCGPEYECRNCALKEDCHGIAKEKKEGGFYSIRDAVQDKMRSDDETWEIEQLCRKPDYRQSIFPGWIAKIHIIDNFYNPGYRLYRAYDFGSTRDPFVCLWLLVDMDRNVYLIDEIYRYNLSPSECWEAMNEHHKAMNYGTCWGDFAEPAGSAYKSEFNRKGTYVLSKMANIIDGIHLIRAALKLNEVSQKPSFFICRRCLKTIEEIEGFNHEKLSKGICDHTISACRYFFINVPQQLDFKEMAWQSDRGTREIRYKRGEKDWPEKNIRFKDKIKEVELPWSCSKTLPVLKNK